MLLLNLHEDSRNRVCTYSGTVKVKVKLALHFHGLGSYKFAGRRHDVYKDKHSRTHHPAVKWFPYVLIPDKTGHVFIRICIRNSFSLNLRRSQSNCFRRSTKRVLTFLILQIPFAYCLMPTPSGVDSERGGGLYSGRLQVECCLWCARRKSIFNFTFPAISSVIDFSRWETKQTLSSLCSNLHGK